MGQQEMERIKKIFTNLDLHPQYMEHKEVITSQDAAKTRGFPLKEGIKAILFTNGNDEWVIVDVPADKKVDPKKVATQIGWSKNKTKIANREQVMQKTNCEIGAVPPFGHKDNVQILVDKGIYENGTNSFNIGLRTNSVRIKSEEIKKVFDEIGVIEGEFSK